MVIFGTGKNTLKYTKFFFLRMLKYTKLIKEMYNKIVGVRTSGGITSEFPITIGLH